MDIRRITDSYAVAPQIAPEDAPAIAKAGYVAVICNRPDGEVPEHLQSERVRAAVEAAGLTFVDNPFSHQAFSMDLVDRQSQAIEAAQGPVLAYCATGNRCSVLWGLGRAKAGALAADEILEKTAAAGYDLRNLRPQLETLSGD